MTQFTSILFDESQAAIDLERVKQPECFGDLHLDQIVSTAVRADAGDTAAAHADRFFHLPLHDIAAVEYRHEVFRDLERDPVRAPIDALVTGMRTMRTRLNQAMHLSHRLQQLGWFAHAADAYCQTMVALAEELNTMDVASRGLRRFADYVAGYVAGDRFRTLAADTADVQAALRTVRYTVHIEGLKVHVDKYNGQTNYGADVATIFDRFAAEAAKDYRIRMTNFVDMDHVEERVLDCVARLFPAVFSRLDAFYTQHQHYPDATITRFDREVRFYLYYLEFMRRFTRIGLQFCYPRLTETAATLAAHNAFDLALAIKAGHDDLAVVCNDFELSKDERVIVITGPNQGGKTTFARTIGQVAYLGALGCPVPAEHAVVALPDEIYTHFERQETLATLRGKLDNELVRIHDILSDATPSSIIVMNESFSSTTVDDSVLIGTEVLRRIIAVGCAAVYVTFLDELASLDPVCVSMVGEVAPEDPTQRTFVFTRRPADGFAYAAALADKYGLAHDALLQRISQ